MWYRTAKLKNDQYTSAIVAVWLDEADAAKMTSDIDTKDPTIEYLPNDSYHVTLIYLGEAKDLKDKKDLITGIAESVAGTTKRVKAKIGGVGRFYGKSDKDPVYFSVDSAELCDLRERLRSLFSEIDIETDETHGFTPHMTCCYAPPGRTDLDIEPRSKNIKFNKLTVAWAGKKSHYDFGG